MDDLTLTQRVEHLHSECCELRRRLNEKELVFDTEVGNLKEEIAIHLRTINDLNNTMNELSRELKDCVSIEKYKMLETRLEEECNRYENLVNLNEKYTKLHTAKSEECELLLKDLAEKDELLEASKASIKSMVTSLEKYATIEEELTKAKREISEYSDERKSLIEEVESLRNTVTYYEELKHKSHNEFSCDESMEVESPRNRSICASESVDAVFDIRFKELENELEEHKAMLNARNEEIETLKRDKELHSHALEESKNRVVSLEEAAKINKEEVTRLNNEIIVFEDFIKSLNDQMEKCNGTINEYQKCLANYQAKINDFEVKVSQLISENEKSESKLKKQISELSKELQEWKQLVKDKDDHIQKVLSEKYEKKTSLEKCKLEITRVLAEKEKMETETSHLKLDLKTLSPEVDSIRQSFLKQENEIETPQNRKENIAKELIRSNSEIEYLVGRSTRIQLCSTSDENESPFCLSFKRPQPMQRNAVQSKRNRSLFPKNMNVMNTNPETELNIMKAVQKADQDANLIGDFTKTYALPLIVNSKHQDLKAISSETLASVIKGEYNELILKYVIVDCRYPYEYEGGHIVGAKNIYTQDQILAEFFDEKVKNEHKLADISGKRNIVIFHCEFSSERGPSLYRYLRSKDRELNTYPNLYHPEVYLLNGGYKAFFESFKELCSPQQYLPMLSKDHKHHLRQFRKSKSWNCENKFAANTVNLNRQ